MKKIFTTLCTLLLFTLTIALSAQSQIYVDASATGNETGVDWENAYTDLQAALLAATAGQTIHVAQGAYKPDVPGGDPAATFYISVDLTLLGGYPAGGGTRNPDMYPTILSGDLNGDDVPGDLTANRADNAMTVVTVPSNRSLMLDGFVISNGQADGTGPNNQKQGGGLYCSTNTTVTAIACSFVENFAQQGGGIHSAEANSCVFQNCNFLNNSSDWGGAVSLYSLVGSFENCLFRENTAEGNAGSIGIYCQYDMQGTPSLEFTNCTFENNESKSGRGGGLHIVIEKNNATLNVNACSFTQNKAKLSGGGINLQSGPNHNPTNFQASINDCLFDHNEATDLAGGGLNALLQSKASSLSVTNSVFTWNYAGIFGGGALVAGDDPGDGILVVSDCDFQNNSSLMLAGGLAIGNDPGVGAFDHQVIRCMLRDNTAGMFGGGMVLFNESTGPAIPDSFWVEECVLENNVSEDMGGGLGLFTTNPGMSAVIRNCRLIDNSAASGAAVAIDPVMAEFPGVADAASIRFEGCLMTGNTAPNATLTVRQTGIVELFNCTLADNMAGGLTIDAGGVATMQNTILSNPGYTEYQSLAGNATLASNGGNLIHDGSLGSSNPADMENQSPYFIEGPDCEFYQLSTESPGFDGGVEWDDVPAFDVCGNARIHGNQIDVGAVETPIVATQEAKTGRLAIAPNPANHLVNVEWAAEWDGSLEVYLFSAAGRQLMHHILMKGQSIPLNSIPAGMYTLRMIDETGRVYAGKFVKQ